MININRKFNKTKEWLYDNYVIQDRSILDIANDCGLTRSGLKSKLAKYGIRKQKVDISINELSHYLDEGKSVTDICLIYHCSDSRIYDIMKRHNLTTHYKPDHHQYDDSHDKQICSMYLSGSSLENIANNLKISRCSVKNHLLHCGITLRTMSQSLFNYREKEFPVELYDRNYIYDLYVNLRLSKKDLSIKFGVDPSVIHRVLKGFNISIRSNSESKIGLMTGDNHPNWQGGITDLNMRLRTIFLHRIEPLVRDRDKCTCLLCGSLNDIHVHHKIPFSLIVKEIVSEHENLDIHKDTDELINIITKDKRFTDTDNLICVCKDCHLYKIHHFKK